MTPDLVYDQMIGMGCASTLTFSWGGNPGVGSLHRLRDAVEHGWPRPLELDEHSHAGMAAAYCAGAARLPFGMLRGYIGTDLVQAQSAHRRTSSARSPASASRRCRRSIPTSRSCTRSAPIAPATSPWTASSARSARPRSRRAALVGHGGGDRRGVAAGDERDRAAALGRERRGALPRRRVSLLRAGLLRARQRVLSALGCASRASATASSAWMQRHVLGQPRPRGIPRQPRGSAHERLHPRRDDDHRGGAPAVGRLRLLRRHRPAERGLQSGAAHARARTSC